MVQTLPSVCPLDCGDTCSMTVTVEDQQIVTLVGPENTFQAGDAVSIELTDPLFFDDRGWRLRTAV